MIFSDGYSEELKEIAQVAEEEGTKYTREIEYKEISPTGCHGTEPPEEL